MNVLIITDYAFKEGGISIFINNIISNNNGAICYSIITWKNEYTENQNNNIWKQLKNVTLLDEVDLNSLATAISNNDIVFVQTSWNVRLLAYMSSILCKELHKPLISVMHTSSHSHPDSKLTRIQFKWMNEIIEYSSKVICVSEGVKKSLSKVPNLNQEKLRIIPNGSRYSMVSKATKDAHRFNVSFVGRAIKAKGIDDFMEIANLLSDTDIRFLCNKVNNNSEYEFIHPPNVEIVHSLNHDEMLEFYMETDILIAPYRHSEGMPLSVLEAISLNIPVIGYDSPGLKEILLQNRQVIVETGNKIKIVEHLRQWIKGNSIFPTGTPCHVNNWSQISNKYIEEFKSVIK